MKRLVGRVLGTVILAAISATAYNVADKTCKEKLRQSDRKPKSKFVMYNLKGSEA